MPIVQCKLKRVGSMKPKEINIKIRGKDEDKDKSISSTYSSILEVEFSSWRMNFALNYPETNLINFLPILQQ